MDTRRIPLSFIPPLLPDQTLYSWVTVFHEMSGNASKEETLLQIIDSEKAGRQFHIPSHLDAFCASTQCTLGDPGQLINIATILPSYLRFRSNNVAADVLQRVRGNQTAGVAQTLRLARSRLYTFPPRRGCHQCAEDDLSNHGIAYWHRSHQLPGSLICIWHGTTLYSAPMISHDKMLGGFITPAQDLRRIDVDTTPCHYSEEENRILSRLAILATQMATQSLAGGYSRPVMRHTCIAALQARNMLCDNVTECLMRATQDYTNHFSKVAWIPDLACVLAQRSTKPLWSLLSNTQHPDHPLEYLLLIDWLFGSWETFSHQYSMHLPWQTLL